MRTGRVQRRGKLLELAWARVLREAGGRVVASRMLKDLRIPGVDPTDKRRIENFTYGLPIFRGIPLACDCTFVSPVQGTGDPVGRAASVPGFAMAQRRDVKIQHKYHELILANPAPAKLLVLECETGGRWGEEATNLVALLAKSKAREQPHILRRSVEYAFHKRWWSILSVQSQRAFAASLADDFSLTHHVPDDLDLNIPLHEVLQRCFVRFRAQRLSLGPVACVQFCPAPRWLAS